VLVGNNEDGRVLLADVETGSHKQIFSLSGVAGGWISQVAWSRDEQIVAGWVQSVWRHKDAGGVRWDPFVVDLKQGQITLFWSELRSYPLFIIDEPDVVKSLTARSHPWK
jgi:hypothetical protein